MLPQTQPDPGEGGYMPRMVRYTLFASKIFIKKTTPNYWVLRQCPNVYKLQLSCKSFSSTHGLSQQTLCGKIAYFCSFPILWCTFAQNDVNLEGYHKHLEAEKAPPPLTYEEQEKQLVKEAEVRTDPRAHYLFVIDNFQAENTVSVFNPFTPKFKMYILPNLQKRNV